MQLNVDERSKKSDIIDGCMEYVAHVEANSFDKEHVRNLCVFWAVLGLFVGLAA